MFDFLSKRAVYSLILCAVFFLSGCTTVKTSSNNGNKRFLQLGHPVTGSIVMQITYPNERGCRSYQSLLRREIAKNVAVTSVDSGEGDLVNCSDISASADLSYICMIKNNTYDFMFSIETVSYDECVTVLDTNLDLHSSLEMVEDCSYRDVSGELISTIEQDLMAQERAINDMYRVETAVARTMGYEDPNYNVKLKALEDSIVNFLREMDKSPTTFAKAYQKALEDRGVNASIDRIRAAFVKAAHRFLSERGLNPSLIK